MGRVHLFIVSVDRDAPGFQASARRVDEEVAGQFEQPHALLEFLVGRPVASSGRAAPPATPDSHEPD